MSTDPADPAHPRRPRPAWTVHYVDRRIAVTSWHVTTADGTRYHTRDLDHVLRVHTYAHTRRSLTLIVGGLEVAVATPLAVASHAPLMFVVGTAAVVGVTAGILHDARRHPRWMELRATYRGEEVVLFASRRLDEFERVRFALIRALQGRDDPFIA